MSRTDERGPWIRPQGDTEWMTEAACKGMTEVFFRTPTNREKQFPELHRQVYAEAARTCEGCPVIEDCTEWIFRAEASTERNGFVAGLTPENRRRIHRQAWRKRVSAMELLRHRFESEATG